jgi:hypothetical protein
LLNPTVKPDYEQRWTDLCSVEALLRKLQSLLYSKEKTTEISVKTIKELYGKD